MTTVARKIPNIASEMASKTPAREGSLLIGEDVGVGDLDCTNGWMDSRTIKLIDLPEPNRPIDHSARQLPDG
jgi:hypothetical protein